MKKGHIQTLLAATLFALICAGTSLASDGWQQNADGRWQYTQNEKKTINQWVKWSDGTMRFVDENGIRYENSWFTVDYPLTNPMSTVGKTWYYAGSDGQILKDGWYELNGANYYFYAGGNSPKKAFFKVIDKTYYVDENGARQQNGWFQVNGAWYYANLDGSLLLNGWYELGGNNYYFNTAGSSPRKTWVNVGTTRYYVDENGVRQQGGWFAITLLDAKGQEYKNWYYTERDGALVPFGWRDMDGKRYFFDQNGYSYRKRWFIDGDKNRYYLDESGVLQRGGWFKISNKNVNTGVVIETWYYSDAAGAVYKDGYHEIEGHKYYFDANGTLYKKRWLTKKNGAKQYVNDDGILQENTWFCISGVDGNRTEYTNWYYAGEDGEIVANGWHTIDGKNYHFNAGGLMSTGWVKEGDIKDIYYCGDDGARRYGWQWIEIPTVWSEDSSVVNHYYGTYGKDAYFYFDPTSGKKKYCKSGTYQEITVDGLKYCIDEKGIVQLGWIRLIGTSPAIKGYRYYYPEKTAVDESGNQTYVQGARLEDNRMMLAGPETIDAPDWVGMYYFSTDGEPMCSRTGQYQIRKFRDSRYAFDRYGHAQRGLLKIDNNIYYFGDVNDEYAGMSGKCKVMEKSGEATYYFSNDGSGVTGIRDDYCYYKGKLQKADGNIKYEVFDLPGTGKRLLNASGKVMKGKTIKDGDKQVWTLASGGTIKKYGSDAVAELVEPELEEE